MSKSKTLTRRQQIDKMKVKWYNQLRNLQMRQFKELSRFYEQDAADLMENKRRKNATAHVPVNPAPTNI